MEVLNESACAVFCSYPIEDSCLWLQAAHHGRARVKAIVSGKWFFGSAIRGECLHVFELQEQSLVPLAVSVDALKPRAKAHCDAPILQLVAQLRRRWIR